MSLTLTQARSARAEAAATGVKTYTGQTCTHGHDLRYTANGACVQCAKAARSKQLADRKAKRLAAGLSVNRGRPPVIYVDPLEEL